MLYASKVSTLVTNNGLQLKSLTKSTQPYAMAGATHNKTQLLHLVQEVGQDLVVDLEERDTKQVLLPFRGVNGVEQVVDRPLNDPDVVGGPDHGVRFT